MHRICKRRYLFHFAVALLILLALRMTAPQTHTAWDAEVLGWFSGKRTPALDQVMLAVTWLGSLFILAPAAIFLALKLKSQGRQEQAWFLIYSLAGAALLGRLAKGWIARPRPDIYSWISSLPADTSYPSLHALQATAFFLSLALIAANKTLGLAALVMASIIAISRLYLQVHFPSDIAAGALAAIIWTFTLYWTHSQYHEK